MILSNLKTRTVGFLTGFTIVILAAFAVGYYAWSESLRDEQDIIQNSPNPLFNQRGGRGGVPEGELEGWQTYRNEEYGFEVKYPKDFEVSFMVNSEVVPVDKGRIGDLRIGRRTKGIFEEAFSAIFTSHDFEFGAGEGCCFVYTDAPIQINSNISLAYIEKQVVSELGVIGPLFKFRFQNVYERPAVRFFRLNGYIESWLVDSVLMPFEVEPFDNVLVSSPSLIDFEYAETQSEIEVVIKKAGDFVRDKKYLDNAQTREKYEIFDQILSSFKLIPPADVSKWKTLRIDKFSMKYPPTWNLLEGGIDCASVNQFNEHPDLRLVEFGRCWEDHIGGELLSFEQTYDGFRSGFSRVGSIEKKRTGGIELEVIKYHSSPDSTSNHVYGVSSTSGTIALWKIDDKGFFLLDENNARQSEGIFEKILSTFRFIE